MRWSNMSVFCFSSISSAVLCSTMLSRLSAYFSSLCSMLSIMSNFLQRRNRVLVVNQWPIMRLTVLPDYYRLYLKSRPKITTLNEIFIKYTHERYSAVGLSPIQKHHHRSWPISNHSDQEIFLHCLAKKILTFLCWWTWEFSRHRQTKVYQSVLQPSIVSSESRRLDVRPQTAAGAVEVGRTVHECLWFCPRSLQHSAITKCCTKTVNVMW